MEQDTGMHDSDDRAYGTVAEVAAAYGVSPDTIRRRMRKGELVARREEIPSGYRWLLPMPAPGEPLPGSPPVLAAIDHAAMVDVLRGELATRNAEIERLHALLDVQARALEAVTIRPTAPERALPVTTAENEAVGSPESDETGSTGISTRVESIEVPRSGWARFMAWLSGQ